MSPLQVVGAMLLVAGIALFVLGVRAEAVSPAKGTPQEQPTWLLGIGILIALVGAGLLLSWSCPSGRFRCL